MCCGGERVWWTVWSGGREGDTSWSPLLTTIIVSIHLSGRLLSQPENIKLNGLAQRVGQMYGEFSHFLAFCFAQILPLITSCGVNVFGKLQRSDHMEIIPLQIIRLLSLIDQEPQC